MMLRAPLNATPTWLVPAGAAVSALLGAAVTVDWTLASAPARQAAALARVQALGASPALLLGAVALLAGYAQRERLAALAGGAILALGLATLLARAVAPLDLAGNPVPPAFSPHHLPPAHPMTPLTALAVATAGLGLLAAALSQRPRLSRFVLFTLGAVVSVVALLGLLGFGLAVMTADGTGRLRGMGIAAGIGLLAMGVGMLGTAAGVAVAEPDEPAGRFFFDAAPLAGMAFAVIVTLTFLGFQWMVNDFQTQMRAKLQRITANAVDDVGDRMPAYALAMRAAAHFVQQSQPLTRAKWAGFVESIGVTTQLPGLLGFGYLDAIPAADLSAHMRNLRRLWPDGYAVFPAGVRPEYFPVALVAPLTARSRQIVGLDHGADPSRLSAIEMARDQGQPTISRALVLMVDRDHPGEFAFHMYMPVYRNGAPIENRAQRRRALMGLVFGPFRLHDLMTSILLDRYDDVRLRVLDGELPDGARLVFDSTQDASGQVFVSAPPDSVAVGAIVFGRRWTVVCSPLPQFFAGEPSSGPWVVLAGGVLISFLLAAAIWQLFAIQSRARSLSVAHALNAEREQARRNVEELNQELSRRADALEMANRDLEAFTYSVSHDLQQPVTGITAYAGMALEDFTGEMSAEVKSFFERIQVASRRMAQLISGLMALSSIARSELTLAPVDLTALARETIAELEATHKLREIEIVIAEGLSATGDRRLLQILVTNLLGNAWKYTGKTERPRIEMGQAETPQGTAFFVRDNGAGFDMARADKLFYAFQRLHRESDFPGTGIGLATVLRIVTRHGGKIWADARPGEGATFYFTLPA